MEQHLSALKDGIQSAWRFRRSALLVAWAVALVGWFVTFLIPAQYESTARVFVDTNSLLKPLLEGIAVQPNATDQVNLVRRALLSRTQLEQVVSQTALNRRTHNAREREDQIQTLMKEIRIDADSSTPNSRDLNMYAIHYMDTDAKLAYSVVKTLLDSLVGQSLGANRSNADTAQKFLREQLNDYERRLTEAETRLADFKRANIDAMPDERGGYFQSVQSDTAELDRLSAQLTVAVNKRDELRGKLVGTAQAANGTSPAGTSAIETSVDGRLRESRQREAELLMRFTDNHPDVIAARETIARLEQSRAAELAEMRSSESSLGTVRASTSPVMQSLQIALNQAELDVTGLRAQVLDRQQRLANLRKRIGTMPEIEAQLMRLNRDYTVTKAEYEKLLQRFEQARISDAADRVDSVRFRVIDLPVEAVSPAKPKRALLVLVVLFGALGIAGVYAWMRSRIAPVVASAKLNDTISGVPVIARIEQFHDAAAYRVRRFRVFLVGATIGALGVTAALLTLVTPIIETMLPGSIMSLGAR